MMNLTVRLMRMYSETTSTEFRLPGYLEPLAGTSCDLLCTKPQNIKNLDGFSKLRQDAQKIVNITRALIESRDKLYSSKSKDHVKISQISQEISNNLKRLNSIQGIMNSQIRDEERKMYDENGEIISGILESDVVELNNKRAMLKNVKEHIKRLDTYYRAMGKMFKSSGAAATTATTMDAKKNVFNPNYAPKVSGQALKVTSPESASQEEQETASATTSIQIASASIVGSNSSQQQRATDRRRRITEDDEESSSDDDDRGLKGRRGRNDSSSDNDESLVSRFGSGSRARNGGRRFGDNEPQVGDAVAAITNAMGAAANNYGSTSKIVNTNMNGEQQEYAEHQIDVERHVDNRKTWDDLLPIYEDSDQAEEELNVMEKKVDDLIDQVIDLLNVTKSKAESVTEALMRNDETIDDLHDKITENIEKLTAVTKTTEEVRKKLGGGAKVIFWIVIVLALIGIGYWCYSIIDRYAK